MGWKDRIAELQEKLVQAEAERHGLAVAFIELVDKLTKEKEVVDLQNKAYREALEFVASQKNLMFAECTQAEEIVARCAKALEA